MILPPDSPPAGQPAGRAAVPGGWDEEFLAGLDQDTEGLDLEALAEREEPSEEELAGLLPDLDDEDDPWLAALAAGRGSGFAEGGPLDGMTPGGALAGFSGYAMEDGLAGLTDDALVGLLRASRRLSAWQAGVELAAVSELDHRRRRESRRPGWSRVSEHIAAELAVALVLTGRSADSLLGLARDLDRLPAVRRALLAGQIDRARAAVFAAELAALTDCAANAAAAAFLREAPELTTGQLRAALRTLVRCIDPAAVRKRMTKARGDARVETWQEGSGNLALAGRELDPADAIVADRRITAIAEALRKAGAAGSLDQLRAAVFTALLAGRDPDALLTNSPGSDHVATSRPPEAGAGAGVTAQASGKSAGASDDAAQACGTGTSTGSGGLAQVGGSVHLVLPASTWLGLSDLPGEAAGLGPLDAWSSRDLATRLAAAGTRTQWRVTLTRPDGTAAAHACARTGPGPPEGLAAWRAWLARQRFTWLERGNCSHVSQAPGYRPPSILGDVIRARNRTCAHPGCRRPSAACDLDHTIPWQEGGRTCSCNLAPFCRRHHQVKQTPGWTVTQPEPGAISWTAPHGRSYRVGPSTYLT